MQKVHITARRKTFFHNYDNNRTIQIKLMNRFCGSIICHILILLGLKKASKFDHFLYQKNLFEYFRKISSAMKSYEAMKSPGIIYIYRGKSQGFSGTVCPRSIENVI